MLSDEEKKAIERVEQFIDGERQYNTKTGETIIPYEYGESQIFVYKETYYAIQVVLNLIEKQSKEIEELKKQDLSNSKIRDKIRNRIKYLTEYYEKEVKPEMYHWGDFTAEEYYAGIITELKMILFKDCMVDN